MIFIIYKSLVLKFTKIKNLFKKKSNFRIFENLIKNFYKMYFYFNFFI